MSEYRVQVKKWMTNYDSFMDNDSFLMKENSTPMPMCIMYGEKIKETPKLIQMKLHGDIKEQSYVNCMKCGKKLTNKVSQYFGIGPECGGHNYTNPFDTKEELENAINEIREKLKKVEWTGWILKSAIVTLELIDGEEEQVEEEQVVVNVEIEKSIKCNGGYSLFISFPYNYKIVEIMRSKLTRYWDKDTLKWELPIKYYNDLMVELKDYDVKVTNVENIPIEMEKDLSIKNNIPDGYKFKTDPFKHQVDGVNYGLSKDRFLLGDEQGLGKTMQAINIAVINKQQKGYKHCLIVCGVNGLKWNWQKEVKKHSDEGAFILGSRLHNGKEVIGSVEERLKDLEGIEEPYVNDKYKNLFDAYPYFIITNIETLRNEKIIDKLKELCDKQIIDMIIVDEIHKCKDPSSIQGKHLLKLNAKSMIAMTGTPLMNNPLDLYTPMKWLGYENHNFYSFKNHYCEMGGYGGYQVVGYKHLDQLREEFDDIMLRRLKKDVLDLPEKIYTNEYVEMTPKQERIYKEVYSEIKNNIDLVSKSTNPLAEMIRLRQATGYTGILSSAIKESAKLDRLDELLEEIVSNGNKAIIFSNWTSITNPVYERYQKYNPAMITGETKDNERAFEEKKFMEDPTCKIIIGTTGAMGTGLTLTAANTVIFLDEPWNRALKEQAEDRAHRIGTKENVNIITLITKNTIDERINEIVEAKGAMADLLVGGKVTNGSKEQLVDFLLS